MYFEDRTQAGQKLAHELAQRFPELLKNKKTIRPSRSKANSLMRPKGAIMVAALPRGGVPVAFEIAKALHAPLDLIVTHKLGAPENEEFAIGAVAEDGSSFVDPEASGFASKDYIKEEIRRQLGEIQKRIKKYRGGRPLPNLNKKIIILVDDGIATGNTMKAACALAKNQKAERVIVAVPVLPSDTLRSLQKMAEVVFLDTPKPFFAIGRFYRNFEQLTDEEVRSYLRDASK